jgi:hypothetical protein
MIVLAAAESSTLRPILPAKASVDFAGHCGADGSRALSKRNCTVSAENSRPQA